MLQTKISDDQVRCKIKGQLVSEIIRLINIARSDDIHNNQSIQLKRYFVGNLIKTDTSLNLLFPFDTKFSEVLQQLDLDIALHKQYLELCAQLFLILTERRWDDSSIIHEQYKPKLIRLTEESNTLDDICTQIEQCVIQQSQSLQQLWSIFIHNYQQKLLAHSEMSTVSSEENLSLSIREQVQDQLLNQQELKQLKQDLSDYQQSLHDRGAHITSYLYQGTCRMLNVDATQVRMEQVSTMLNELNEEMTNYQFFALLSKYKKVIKDSYGLLNRYKNSELYQLLDRYSIDYEVKLRRQVLSHKADASM